MLNERSLLSQFLHFVAATVASLMVFSLYSIVDGLFVAKGVGEYAMAAVNLAVPFTNVLFSIGIIFAVGTSTVMTRPMHVSSTVFWLNRLLAFSPSPFPK